MTTWPYHSNNNNNNTCCYNTYKSVFVFPLFECRLFFRICSQHLLCNTTLRYVVVYMGLDMCIYTNIYSLCSGCHFMFRWCCYFSLILLLLLLCQHTYIHRLEFHLCLLVHFLSPSLFSLSNSIILLLCNRISAGWPPLRTKYQMC